MRNTKNLKTHVTISDSVCNDLNMVSYLYCVFIVAVWVGHSVKGDMSC